MGGLGSGRLPDESRRREAIRLRAQGLRPSEIGRALGVSRQRATQILGAIERTRSRRLACRECGGAVTPPGAAPPDTANVLCLGCLARHPEAPFAERLLSCRAAAGLRRQELARRAGVTAATLRRYEDGTRRPDWQHLMPLVRVLGLALVEPGCADGEGERHGRASSPSPEPCPA
jgi:DNA-binding XRE family transcriptional regulator